MVIKEKKGVVLPRRLKADEICDLEAVHLLSRRFLHSCSFYKVIYYECFFVDVLFVSVFARFRGKLSHLSAVDTA